MKIPTDVHGRDFANHLIHRWEFREMRQSGSHILLRTETPSGYTISIPAHKPLRFGTFRDILSDVSKHKGVPISKLLERL